MMFIYMAHINSHIITDIEESDHIVMLSVLGVTSYFGNVLVTKYCNITR